MKVLCIICNDKWMTNSFVAGWKSLGFEVDVFYYSPNLVRVDYSPAGWKMVAEMNRSLVQYAYESERRKNIDLIFCSILDDFISADTLLNLRKLKVPIVNYHCDMVALWFRSIKTASYFDLFCCAHQYGMDALRRKGARVLYSPMAGNPFEQSEKLAKKNDFFDGVTFLGAPIGYRPSILAHLYYNKVPLRIYGHNWDWCPREYDTNTAEIKYFKNAIFGINDKVIHDLYYYAISNIFNSPFDFLRHQSQKVLARYVRKKFDVEEYYAHLPPSIILGPYDDKQFYGLVSGSSINVGFSHISGKEGSKYERMQVRLRDFEIPIAGGFYIAQYSRELSELFIEGEHIVFWKNRNDLLEKVKFYLNNPNERSRIAETGKLYANEHHLWKHRFIKILDKLSINGN